jgi:hypothetical protein
VCITTFYLEGSTNQWYYRFEENLDVVLLWSDFISGINKWFGPVVLNNPLGLTSLQCTRMVDDYCWDQIAEGYMIPNTGEKRGKTADVKALRVR